MKPFKKILRWLLLIVILFIYYFIGLMMIQSKMDQLIGNNNGITTFLMLIAVFSPFIVIRPLVQWLYPGTDIKKFSFNLGILIVLGIVFHIVEIIHENQLNPSYLPYYAFPFFIANALFFLPKNKPVL